MGLPPILVGEFRLHPPQGVDNFVYPPHGVTPPQEVTPFWWENLVYPPHGVTPPFPEGELYLPPLWGWRILSTPSGDGEFRLPPLGMENFVYPSGGGEFRLPPLQGWMENFMYSPSGDGEFSLTPHVIYLYIYLVCAFNIQI